MKYLPFIWSNFLLCSFYAEAQLPVTDSSLTAASYSVLFSGSYGNGLYNEPYSTFGAYSYITPSSPYNTISSTASTSGYTAATSPGAVVQGSITPSGLSAVSLNATAEITYNIMVLGTLNPVTVDLTGEIDGNVTTFENTTAPVYNEQVSSSISVESVAGTNGFVVYSASNSENDSNPA